MANQKLKKLTPTQQEYKKLYESREPARPVAMNCLRAFLGGGLVCLAGECIEQMFVHWAGMETKQAAAPTVAVLILLSAALTGLGVYDKFGQWAGAGSAVPVTGFANAMTSAGIEYKSEGLVLGTGNNMFKLAGGVIVFGTVAAFGMGILHIIYDLARGG